MTHLFYLESLSKAFQKSYFRLTEGGALFDGLLEIFPELHDLLSPISLLRNMLRANAMI